MKKICTSLFLLINFFIYSQNDSNSCDDLKYGTFETYEDGKKIGVFSRNENFQIETYFNKKEYTVAKIKSNNCLFLINSYLIKSEYDTITMSVTYKKIKDGRYSFVAKPAYLNIDYKYLGETIKVDSAISSEHLEIFKTLCKQ